MTNSLQDMRRPLARDVKRETIRSNGHNVIVPPQYVIFMFFFFFYRQLILTSQRNDL